MRGARSARWWRGVIAMTLAAAVVAAPTVVQAANEPAPSAPGYPTWAEVRKAKGNVAATKVEADKVAAALSVAQSASTAASDAALAADAASRQAQDDLEAATSRADALSAQAKKAGVAAKQSRAAVGTLADSLYRSGGRGEITLQLLAAKDPDAVLARLSALQTVTGSWKTTAQQALADQSLTTSLTAQAEKAQAERADLSKKAEDAAARAHDAAAAAQAAVAEAQKHTDTLYAQLAELRDTSADVERRYEIGVKVAKQQAELKRQRELAAQRAAAKAAAAAAARAAAAAKKHSGGGGGGGGGGGYVSSGPSTAGVVVNPAAAQAYARRAIGAYGWGAGQYSCLVSLWTGESGWRANALNPSSGAYGIPQSWPASKMATAGPDWRTNANTQIDWGLAYIRAAYGTPCNAWYSWLSRSPHWY